MKRTIKKGSTSRSVYLFIQDTRYGDNSGLTALVYNTSGLSAYYIRQGQSSASAITLATKTLGTWATGGFKEVDATNMPGWYELDLPDALLASGANYVGVHLKGAANMAPQMFEIDLVDYEPYDAVRLGLTALPNAVAGAAGGLSIGQSPFKKNTAFTNFLFVMYDSTNHAPVTGKTVTATRSIDGAAYASCANSVSEVANGLYKIDLAAADLNGANINLRFTASSADDVNITLPTLV